MKFQFNNTCYNKCPLIIIDTNALIYRYGYGYKNSNYGAIQGCLNLILNVLESLNQWCSIVTCFDSAPYQKVQRYKWYKANRDPMPNFLKVQIPILKDILWSMGISISQKIGFEADDLIGSFISYFKDRNIIIITTDKDLLQLFNKNINIIMLKWNGIKNIIKNEQDIIDYIGVPSYQIVDFLSIAGDASDNIPGIYKIGKKGATQLLKRFKSLHNIISNLNMVKKSYWKKIQSTPIALILFFKYLIKINRNINIAKTIKGIKLYDQELYKAYLTYYELDQLIIRYQWWIEYLKPLTFW